MVVTVTAAAGPFVVTAPNTAVTWVEGESQTVTWNVAGTTANGVNAANIDVFLSTDGGLTYPIQLASQVPNIGSATITVPNAIGTTNRIMVKGSQHIFFDISNANFTIIQNLATDTFQFSNFSIYPNPNKGNFNVKFDSYSSNDIDIMVNDMRGRTIFEKKYPNTGMVSQNIQLENLESGVYLVTVKDGEQKISKKIVIE
jgi:hypothetical protein